MLQSTRTLQKLDLRCHNFKLDSSKLAMRAAPPSTAHNGSTYPSYNSANSSALQATAACSAHGRVVVNNAKSVINNKTNLSEGLPVINNTSAKMTSVVVLSINALITCVFAGLCGL